MPIQNKNRQSVQTFNSYPSSLQAAMNHQFGGEKPLLLYNGTSRTPLTTEFPYHTASIYVTKHHEELRFTKLKVKVRRGEEIIVASTTGRYDVRIPYTTTFVWSPMSEEHYAAGVHDDLSVKFDMKACPGPGIVAELFPFPCAGKLNTDWIWGMLPP